MKIFNDVIANDIQYVSIFMELIGLTLAFIEIKSPKTANNLENWIHNFEGHVNDLGNRISRNKRVQGLITTFIILLLMAVIPSLWGLFDLPRFVWIVFFFIAAIFVFILLLHLLVVFIHSLNSFSNGKAIGSLGVCVASLGTMGEMYQILNLWLG